MTYKFGNYKAEQKNILYFVFVCAIVFADILGNGNLNLLYFFGNYINTYKSENKEKLRKRFSNILFTVLLYGFSRNSIFGE